MATKRSTFLLAVSAAITLSGCASAVKSKPIGETGYLGFGICPDNQGIRVFQVHRGSPADKAGLQEGDVITAYRQADMGKPENRKDFLWDIRNDGRQGLPLTVRRSDGTFKFLKAYPKAKPLYPMDKLTAAIMDEVIAGKRVNLAVVVTQVNHTQPEYFRNAAALQAWKDGVKAAVENAFEATALNTGLQQCGNYGIVDREKTNEVLQEIHLQSTGAVSAETAKEVGKMTGASHLLFLTVTRYQQTNGRYEDEINARLIAVETDSLLASIAIREPVKS